METQETSTIKRTRDTEGQSRDDSRPRDQKRQISFERPDLIVATPGRLIDHMKNTKGFSLEDIEVLVLDEADRLLEMGFNDELMQVVNASKNSKR